MASWGVKGCGGGGGGKESIKLKNVAPRTYTRFN